MDIYIRSILFIFLSMMMNSCTANDRKITMENVEEFKSKMMLNLPIGAYKAKVASYLDENNIGYTYVDTDKTFYASIPKIGRFRIIYVTSLFIRIYMDEKDQLKNIEFDLQHDGL